MPTDSILEKYKEIAQNTFIYVNTCIELSSTLISANNYSFNQSSKAQIQLKQNEIDLSKINHQEESYVFNRYDSCYFLKKNTDPKQIDFHQWQEILGERSAFVFFENNIKDPQKLYYINSKLNYKLEPMFLNYSLDFLKKLPLNNVVEANIMQMLSLRQSTKTGTRRSIDYEQISYLTPEWGRFLNRMEIYKKNKAGNCQVYAELALYYIIINYPEIKAEIFCIPKTHGDHAFVVMNRENEDSNPANWGENSFILDCWAIENTFYPASEYLDKLQDFYVINGKNSTKKFDPVNQIIIPMNDLNSWWIRVGNSKAYIQHKLEEIQSYYPKTLGILDEVIKKLIEFKLNYLCENSQIKNAEYYEEKNEENSNLEECDITGILDKIIFQKNTLSKYLHEIFPQTFKKLHEENEQLFYHDYTDNLAKQIFRVFHEIHMNFTNKLPNQCRYEHRFFNKKKREEFLDKTSAKNKIFFSIAEEFTNKSINFLGEINDELKKPPSL